VSVLAPRPLYRHRLVQEIAMAVGIVVLGVIVGLLAGYNPSFVLSATLAILWGGLFLRVFQAVVLARTASPRLRRLIELGLAFRVPVVFLHLAVGLIIMGGRVDFLGYFGHAERLSADVFTGEFLNWNLADEPDVGGILVTYLFVPVYLFFGPSLFSLFLWSSLLGFLGGLFFLRAFEIEFGDGPDTAFLAQCLFFYPSVAFWSSLLGKDSWMFFSLGMTTYGLRRLLAEPRPRFAIVFAIGAGSVLLNRPPIGAALALAGVGAAVVASREWMSHLRGAAAVLRPISVIVVACVIMAGSYVAVLGPLTRYGVMGESASPVQGLLNLAVLRHGGLATDLDATDRAAAGYGSSIAVRIEDPTVAAALRYLPAALVTFLFRPFIFEAHNGLALLAACDSTLLMLVILRRRRHLGAMLRTMWSRPLVLFAVLAFTMCSAGLAFESNFGAIVRHRIMVLPFLFILLAIPRNTAKGVKAGA
jgi:hypothetical protein